LRFRGTDAAVHWPGEILSNVTILKFTGKKFFAPVKFAPVKQKKDKGVRSLELTNYGTLLTLNNLTAICVCTGISKKRSKGKG
jgi:hypothetical protein